MTQDLEIDQPPPIRLWPPNLAEDCLAVRCSAEADFAKPCLAQQMSDVVIFRARISNDPVHGWIGKEQVLTCPEHGGSQASSEAIRFPNEKVDAHRMGIKTGPPAVPDP